MSLVTTAKKRVERTWKKFTRPIDHHRARTALNYVTYASRHPGYQNPFQTIDIPVNCVEMVWTSQHCANGIHIENGFGQVTNWPEEDTSNHTVPIEQHPVISGIKERFMDSKPWRETQYYEMIREVLSNHDSVHGYESVDAFRENRLAYIDHLYEDIRSNGYQPVTEPGGDSNEVLNSNFHDNFEPMVVIGSTGELFLYEGRHRLGIARIVDAVETIPVHVVARHTDWQRILDTIAVDGESSVSEEFRSHPDVKALA